LHLHVGLTILSNKRTVRHSSSWPVPSVKSVHPIVIGPADDGSGAYNRYFGRQDTGKMKDPGRDGPQGIYARVCAPHAKRAVRGPGRGKVPVGSEEDRAQGPGGCRKVQGRAGRC